MASHHEAQRGIQNVSRIPQGQQRQLQPRSHVIGSTELVLHILVRVGLEVARDKLVLSTAKAQQEAPTSHNDLTASAVHQVDFVAHLDMNDEVVAAVLLDDRVHLNLSQLPIEAHSVDALGLQLGLLGNGLLTRGGLPLAA